MKTLKIVHNIFTVVALLVAMYIGGESKLQEVISLGHISYSS